jgi:serine/threonine protein kinase/Flp pilus assembly protein TadD
MADPVVSDLLSLLQTRLGARFTIERELGRGGMGTVYLAQDRKHRRAVAIKVLEPRVAAALGTARFQREIEIAASLAHPHIVGVHDSGDVDGVLFFVMPYVEGESLRARLERDRSLRIDEAVRIAAAVADALAYAHGRGVVHRDIKPENILLSGGHALVADFGVARAIAAAGAETLTATGLLVGTATYASPEQAGGDREVDGRSDTYSLGCVLFEMLSGEPPFSGATTQAIVLRHLGAPAPSVRVLRPSVPDWLDQAVQRALAKAPADRFATATDFARAISAPDPAARPARPSVAVLPFANLSPDPGSEYFSDGITEEIITALARIPALDVTARTSSFAFKGRTEDVRRIGQQLNVTTVLEGSVRRAGGRLRVTAQLIDTADGYHLWSEKFDRQIEDVFAIQDEIAERIAVALAGLLGSEAAARSKGERAPTTDLEAYDLYLRGRELFHQFRRKQFVRARELFREAVARDPGFARAWAGIAMGSSYLFTTFDASPENAGEAEAASRRAVELAPDVAEARAARGYALAINQRYAEAWPELDAAIRLDPRDFEVWYLAARSRWLAGDLANAAEHFEVASRVRPEDYQAPALAATAYDGLHDAASAERCHRLALERIDRWLELYPNDTRATYLGAIAAIRLGHRTRGLEMLERAASMDPDDPATLYNIACGYAVLGEAERAIDCLERCYQMGFAHQDWIRHDADLDSLRSHPRFLALLARK